MPRDAVILGAGAVGSVLAARLHEAGRDVLAVGRGTHVDRIRREGLRFREPDGVTRVDVPAARDPEPADVFLLTVKTPDLPAAADQAAKMGDRSTLVACQNGVRADDIAAEAVGPGRVAGGVVVFSAEFVDPGEVTLRRDGPLLVGNPWGSPTDRDEAVRDLLEGAHPVELREDLPGARWTKLLVNLNNAVPAIVGAPLQEAVGDRDALRVMTQALQEGVTVVRAAGKPTAPIPWAHPRTLVGVAALPTAVAARVLRWKVRRTLGDEPARPSTLQSVLRDGAAEVRYLNGEIATLAEEVGVQAPVNRVLVEAVEEVREREAFLEPAELARLVEQARDR